MSHQLDTAGEITTRRQTAPILCIMVELIGVEVLFSSSLAPRYEQIFSQRFCSDEFASSISARYCRRIQAAWPRAAKRVTRVLARVSPASQLPARETFIAAPVQACCSPVLARPM